MRFIFSGSNFLSQQKFEIRSPVNMKMIRDYLQKKDPYSYFCYCKLKLCQGRYQLLHEYNDNPEKSISTYYNDLYVVYMKNNKCYCDYTKYQLINMIQNSQNEDNINKKQYESTIKELNVTIKFLEKKEKKNESTIEQLKKNNEKLSLENKRLEAKPEWKKLYQLNEENHNLIEKHSKEVENMKKEFQNEIENLKSEKIELKKKGEDNEIQYKKEMEQINKKNDQLIGKIKNDYEIEIKNLNSMNEKKLNESKQKHNEEIMNITKNNKMEINKLKEEKQKDKKNYEENINNLKKNQKEEQQELENKNNKKK